MNNTYKNINTLQYLGSKARIINEICSHFMNLKGMEVFVDLFAGTGTVGYAMQPHLKVYSNDLEQYAYIINEGLLNGCKLSSVEERDFIDSVKDQLGILNDVFFTAIDAEKSYFDLIELDYKEYKDFCEMTPNILNPSTEDCRLQSIAEIAKKVQIGSSIQKLHLPVLFISYYANTYFGIRQCCEIDAIRASIRSVPDERVQKVFLVALMSAMSTAASTTTHFAQYLKINSMVTCQNIISKRKISILQQFTDKLNEFRRLGLLEVNDAKSVCTNMDYLELLNKIPLGSDVLVYADPPYFKEHYSRYYHVLNTVCKYDYPKISFNNQINDYTIGRYRQDRNVSNFGKKSMALKAFEELIQVCAKNNTWLAISYSDNSIVDVNDITLLMQKYYKVDIIEIPLKHSNQGRSSTSDVTEILLVGKPLMVQKTIGQKRVDALLHVLSCMQPLYDNPAASMHNYMARKPYNIINKIISELCPEEGIVYDPMFGSGTTLIEAGKLGRSAIGSDINAQAFKLANVSLKYWDLKKIEVTIQAFCKDIEKSCSKFYNFEHNGEMRTLERCHFDVVNGDLAPTSYWYKIIGINKKLSPRKSDVPTESFIKEYNSFNNAQIENISNSLLIPNSRIAISKGATVYSYFCSRNLCALNQIIGILKKYQKKYGYEVLELIVSSAINLIKLSDKKASSQMPYWKPQKNVTSRNALMIIRAKSEKILSGLQFLSTYSYNGITNQFNEVVNERKILVRNVPAQKISYTALPRETVDLVLTDPPYTDQVPYLEYSQLWDLILNWNSITNQRLEDELVVSDAPSRKKDINDFSLIFKKVLRRTVHSMKLNAHFVMFYHSFDLRSWSGILKITEACGLAYQGQSPVPNQRKSFKTVMSPKSTLDGNYVIVFRKRIIHAPVFDGSLDDAVAQTVNCAKRIIEANQFTTSKDLYDNGLLKESIEHGYLHLLATRYGTFVDVISPHLEYQDGYWRIK